VLLQYVGSFEVTGEDQRECAENVKQQLLQMKVLVSFLSTVLSTVLTGFKHLQIAYCAVICYSGHSLWDM